MADVARLRAALDEWLDVATKSRASALAGRLDAEDKAPLVDELAGIERGLRHDAAVYGHMQALIDKVHGGEKP